MIRVKAGRPLIQVISHCVAADLPVLLSGRHGVGKSDLLEQAAKELNIGIITRDLSLMEPPDLIGLPKVDGQVTRYFPPSFLPNGGKGLLAFEELNRCPVYMRSPCLQLLTARALNDYRLPEGWLPVAAINPAEEGGYQVDELDPALLSRFVQVFVEPDREEWLTWARANGIHAGVISYIQTDTTAFDNAQSSPRAWSYVSRALWTADQPKASQESLRAIVVGLLGPERGAAFLKFYRDPVRPLTAAEVLDYTKNRMQLRCWIKAGRLDLVQDSLLALEKYLQADRNYREVRADRAIWQGLGSFLKDLPGDLRAEAEAFFEERDYIIPTTRKGK